MNDSDRIDWIERYTPAVGYEDGAVIVRFMRDGSVDEARGETLREAVDNAAKGVTWPWPR